jgi:hypothetical protein
LKRGIGFLFKALLLLFLVFVTEALINSSLDIYNSFAYDKAILRYTPYGYVPLLNSPMDYRNSSSKVKGGEFVYVENWESADNGSVVFAKVRSKFSSGYVNKRMLVRANMNIMPVVSVLLLGTMFFFTIIKIYKKYTG